MNEQNSTCTVVRDLLPLYAEQMVQPKTAEVIRKHLAGCDSCRRAYKELNKSPIPSPQKAEQRMKEVKPLRKFRFRLAMNILGAPLWLPLLLAAVIVVIALWVVLVSALIVMWCLPLCAVCFAIASIFSAIAFAAAGAGGSAVLFTGLFFLSAALSVLCAIGCAKLTALFFRGTWLLLKRIFSGVKKRKKSN